MKKIYLAKSNKANPYDLMLLKGFLAKKQLEVVEYTGGVFSMKPMDECEFMVVVPDFSNLKVEDGTVRWDEPITIGKGLYGSIQYFSSLKRRNKILIYVGNNHMGKLNLLGDANEEDYINYSTMTVRDIIKYDLAIETESFIESPKEFKM